MIHLRVTTRRHGVSRRALVQTAQTLLAAAGFPEASLSLSLVGDRRMRTLNKRHRSQDCPTDVLSFPLYGDGAFSDPVATAKAVRRALRADPETLLGDVVIDLDAALRQAADYDATLDAEVRRLLIHGLLHVLGYDHESPRDRARMLDEERKLAAAIGLHWPYA